MGYMDDEAQFDSDQLIDQLKYAAATVDTAAERLGAIRPTSSPHETATAVEAAICHMSAAYNRLRHLVGTACPHCADRMHTYTDGRPVSTHLHFGEGSRWVHLWHPDPSNPHNKPRAVGELTTRGGTRKQIVIPAVGHLDAVTITDDKRP
jgi:hypothetical protein